jgi:hypothetical protein
VTIGSTGPVVNPCGRELPLAFRFHSKKLEIRLWNRAFPAGRGFPEYQFHPDIFDSTAESGQYFAGGFAMLPGYRSAAGLKAICEIQPTPRQMESRIQPVRRRTLLVVLRHGVRGFRRSHSICFQKPGGIPLWIKRIPSGIVTFPRRIALAP